MASATPAPFQPAVVPGTDGAVVPPKSKPKKEIPLTDNKVLGAKVTVYFRGEDGIIHEASTTVSQDEFKVQAHSLSIEEKHEKKYVKNEDGTRDLVGFEDTGERVLRFQLRYHVR